MLQKDMGKNVQNTDSICLRIKSIDIFFSFLFWILYIFCWESLIMSYNGELKCIDK